MDNTDPATRSAVMARIRSKDTAPEMAVRRALHAAGLRYRLHRRDLPGRPDLVFPARRVALFVHGCFWHQHGCRLSHAPASRLEYWGPKLRRNKERDGANGAALAAAGWTVLTIWECEARRSDVLDALVQRVAALPCTPRRHYSRVSRSVPVCSRRRITTSE